MSVPPSYLTQLTIRLARGVHELPELTRNQHGHFLQTAQRPDGGFAGRLGDSDPYYTSFGLRGLAILGGLYGPPAEKAAQFLRANLDQPGSIVDLVSLVISTAVLQAAAGLDVTDHVAQWRQQVGRQLESLRRQDGGYAKGPQGSASSTYQTFLTVTCLQLLELPIPRPDAIVDFIHCQQDPAGGFREIRIIKRPGTNPTAAAVGTLVMLDALDSQTAENTARFLGQMQNEEGGLLANSRIPVADALSTFTGLVTLTDVGSPDAIDRQAAARFLQQLQGKAGGFAAAAWDDVCDVEYTFYGLGGLALLAGDER
jgi:geranylgeranyl transferase type-2 subunit beta